MRLPVLVFCLFQTVLPYSYANEAKLIRVRIGHSTIGAGEIVISGHDFFVRREGEGKAYFPGKKTLALRVSRFQNEKWEIWGGNLSFNGKPAPPHLLVVSTGERVDVIASLELESYLEGVLAAEIPGHWPVEALKAQAVASRSYAMYQMAARESRAFHVESDIMDQAFRFSTGALTGLRKRIHDAIKATHGMVLSDLRKNIYPAFYHAHCGGHTEEASEVWESSGKAGTFKDPFCVNAPTSAWQIRFSSEELAQKIFSSSELSGQVGVKELQVVDFTGSGRVAVLRLISDNGIEKMVKGQQFRKLLGFANFKSLYFTVQKIGSNFIFSGKGFGHGVGLCQWGARGMAKSGLNFRQILQRYYPTAVPQLLSQQTLAAL